MSECNFKIAYTPKRISFVGPLTVHGLYTMWNVAVRVGKHVAGKVFFSPETAERAQTSTDL